MSKKKSKCIAKRDFVLLCNDDRFVIKKGDNLEQLGVPKLYFTNLKTEKVI